MALAFLTMVGEISLKSLPLQTPTFAWGAAEELIRGFVVGDGHGLGIPNDFLARTEGNIPEVIRFR